MNLYETQEFVKGLYPDRKLTFDFDKSCMREIHFTLTDGKCWTDCRCMYNKVNVFVDGELKHTLQIDPHRVMLSSDKIKEDLSKLEMINP